MVRYGKQLEELRKRLAGLDTGSLGATDMVAPARPPQVNSPVWAFPAAPAPSQPVSFAYNTPAPNDTNNLGFVQLDDWFGGGVEGEEGFGALDLQDFWRTVGPGEVRARIASLIYRLKEDSPFVDARQIFLSRRARSSSLHVSLVQSLHSCPCSIPARHR